jgi:hypothetical protein
MRGCPTLVACTILSLVGPSPAAAQDVFTGTWRVVEARPAPWVEQGSGQPSDNAAMKQGTITLAPERVDGPPPLGCTSPTYELNEVGPDYLFQGGLTDPGPQAAALGFTGTRIKLLSMSCVRDDADIGMDFALADDDTAMFALDNVIYRMVRAP